MNAGTLHDRLSTIAGNLTYRHLAELTGTNHETVRRYMQGQAPSVEFLTGLCGALNVSAAWLLTGQGPMRVSEVRTAALGEADVSELLSALSNTLTALIERVERLEIYVQTMEVRLRGAAGGPVESRDGSSRDGSPRDGSSRDGASASEPVPEIRVSPGVGRGQGGGSGSEADERGERPSGSAAGGSGGAAQFGAEGGVARQRARRIADAVAERSPEDGD